LVRNGITYSFEADSRLNIHIVGQATNGEEALRLAGLAQGPSPLTAHGCLGHLHLVQGEVHAAIATLEPGLALCRATDEMDWSLNIAGALGEAYARVGRLAEGIALLEQAFSDAVERGAFGFQGELAQQLGTVYLLATRLDEAVHHARRALDVSRQQKKRGIEAAALLTWAEIHAHPCSSEIREAQGTYRKAQALAEICGMRPLIAHCHLGLGRLSQRTGKRDEALEHLTTAMAMYREMGMSYWLEQAEVEMSGLT